MTGYRRFNYEFYKTLDHGQQWLVQWEYGMASHFVTALFELLARCDASHLEKMRLAFPEAAEAMDRFKHQAGYWPALERDLEPKTEGDDR